MFCAKNLKSGLPCTIQLFYSQGLSLSTASLVEMDLGKTGLMLHLLHGKCFNVMCLLRVLQHKYFSSSF